MGASDISMVVDTQNLDVIGEFFEKFVLPVN